jgi:hypothetical protein
MEKEKPSRTGKKDYPLMASSWESQSHTEEGRQI